MNRFSTILSAVFLLPLYVGADTVATKISFNDKVRPILNRSCVGCHGGVKKAGNVSLIYREEALGKGESKKFVIVPGKPMESELYLRIISKDPKYMMPEPGDHGKPLDEEEVAIIKQWIEEGAHWEEHWAYIKPVKHETTAKDTSWAKQPMDNFVMQRLESLDLKPSSESDKAQWLRRASFDIIGLPPTKDELQNFITNTDPKAYEQEVDRLLASPRYGERWASLWMDLARYSDTKGYEKDGHRDVWLYREWLINSFNADMPYDQFIKEQLAGDLMKNPTANQLIATAFNRNTQTNTEGGTDDEEFRVAAVIDRTNTTWSALQGLTFGCTQCHSHPYEPIPHEDYFRFTAFFNNTKDADLDNEYPQLLIAHDPNQRDKAVALQLGRDQMKLQLNEHGRKLIAKDKTWKPLQYASIKSSAGKIAEKGGIVETSGTHPVNVHHTLNTKPSSIDGFTALKFDIVPQEKDPAKLPERGSVLSHLIIEHVKADGSKVNIPFNTVFADSVAGPHAVIQSARGGGAGFGGYPKLFKRREAVFIPNQPIVLAEGDSLEARVYCATQTTGNQATSIRKFQIYSSKDPAWTEVVKSAQYQADMAKAADLNKQLSKIKGSHIPVMAERDSQNIRETRMFIKGLWLNKGEVVKPGVPKVLNEYKASANDRLEMANWMANNENPLTARVQVNRMFSELFGRGIVETLGDFGTTGVKPNNIPLLDHLALSFQDKYKWSTKKMLREMVLSSTYRQDNKATTELASKDPGNRWLARGPRTRLTAEMIRDNALSVSGLATHKIGGRSVMPPQPDGVWQSVYSGAKWTNAVGPDRYRRSVYTYWKRTSPYPSMLTFDAPSRDICVPQRISTNTPLQALVTLNDPVFLECAQKFAEKLDTAGSTIEEKISAGYLLTTQQKAPDQVVKTLVGLYHDLTENYKKAPHDKLASTPEKTAMVIVANALLNIDAAITK